MSKHLFAFYKKDLSQNLPAIEKNEQYVSKDADLWNRLVKIVRIQPGESFILFDKHNHVELAADKALLTSKRIITGIVKKKAGNRSLQPTITLFLPILKKEALAYACYVAAQMGVQTVVPVVTQKSRPDLDEKELTRLQKIMITACEQAKQFVPPTIVTPIALIDVPPQKIPAICFDEDAHDATILVNKLTKEKPQALALTLGPEGGFRDDEEKTLRNAGFTFYKLTPTILRSREALAVGLGLIRSIT